MPFIVCVGFAWFCASEHSSCLLLYVWVLPGFVFCVILFCFFDASRPQGKYWYFPGHGFLLVVLPCKILSCIWLPRIQDSIYDLEKCYQYDLLTLTFTLIVLLYIWYIYLGYRNGEYPCSPLYL